MPTLHKGAGTLVHFVKRGTFAQIKNVTGGLFSRPAAKPSQPELAPKPSFEEITKRGAIAAARIKIRLAEIALKKALNS
jgi:hypothetical protein